MSVFDQIVENQEKQIFYDTLGTFCTLQKQQEQIEQQQAILNEQKKSPENNSELLHSQNARHAESQMNMRQ
ncbi:MAG: hypothetical protein ACR2NF_02740 [Pirellulales bacterium]